MISPACSAREGRIAQFVTEHLDLAADRSGPTWKWRDGNTARAAARPEHSGGFPARGRNPRGFLCRRVARRPGFSVERNSAAGRHGPDGGRWNDDHGRERRARDDDSLARPRRDASRGGQCHLGRRKADSDRAHRSLGTFPAARCRPRVARTDRRRRSASAAGSCNIASIRAHPRTR